MACLPTLTRAQAPAPTPLLRDLVLRTDTLSFSLSHATFLVKGEPHLYFTYRRDDETVDLTVVPYQPQKPLRLVRSADFQLLDSLTLAPDGK
jgi:hypothetical protein